MEKKYWVLTIFVLFILLIIFFIFPFITFQPIEAPVGKVGLALSLTTDIKKIKTNSPITFVLRVENLASENATDISAELIGWRAVTIKRLDLLMPNEIHKFSWIINSPDKNGTYKVNATVFYKMKSWKNIGVKVYNKEYLQTLPPEQRKSIQEKSALYFSSGSSKTPIEIYVSIQQPFILIEKTQEFPFVVELRNVGDDKIFSFDSVYKPSIEEKNIIRFEYEGEKLSCDVRGDVKLENNVKRIVCKFVLSDIKDFSVFTANFTASYACLNDKASTTINVI